MTIIIIIEGLLFSKSFQYIVLLKLLLQMKTLYSTNEEAKRLWLWPKISQISMTGTAGIFPTSEYKLRSPA